MIDLNVCEYAHLHGLSQNHLDVDPLQIERHFSNIDCHPTQCDDDLRLLIGNTDPIALERLTADHATISLLASCIKPPERQEAEHCQPAERFRFRDFAMEPPLLRTDPNSDAHYFKRKIAPDFENEHVPMETIDEDAEEGLACPPEYHKDLSRIWREIRNEKPAMTRKAFSLLCDCIAVHKKPAFGSSDAGSELLLDVKVAWSVGKKIMKLADLQKRQLNPMVSPPILPMSPVTSAYVPSPESEQHAAPSDITSLLGEDIVAAEDAVFANERMKAELVDAPNMSEFVEDFATSEPICNTRGNEHPDFPSPGRVPVHSLKVEVPLSPSRHQGPPWLGTNEPISMTLDQLKIDIPNPTSPGVPNVDDENDRLLGETIAPEALKARQSVEQEQLQEAKHELRLKVPSLDLSRPPPPWLAKGRSDWTLEDCLDGLKSFDSRKLLWPLSGKTQRLLTWVPFAASMASIESLDNISADDRFMDTLARPSPVDTETLLWKPGGLRMFDELEEIDEDELEEGRFSNQNDTISLVRKRKREMQDEKEGEAVPKRVAADSADCNEGLVSHEPHLKCGDPLNPHKFTAVRSLDLLIGHKRGQMQETSVEKSSNVQVDHFSRSTITKESEAMSKDGNKYPLGWQRSAPDPIIAMPPGERQYVVSTDFLAQRSLSRRLSSLCAWANVVERGGETAADGCDPVAFYADLTISPSTGIICTSLQKIKQRALPGEEKSSAQCKLRDKIIHAAFSHEQVFVLVSQNCSEGGLWPSMNTNDCAALVEFTAFCASLEQGVSTKFVPGGEEQLVKWIAALIIQHGLSNDGFQMTEDVAAGECLLTLAGMNAYAAQLLLWQLQQHNKSSICDLISMPKAEKLHLFGRLLGGTKYLERLNEVFETSF